jgi:hypothetical protein
MLTGRTRLLDNRFGNGGFLDGGVAGLLLDRISLVGFRVVAFRVVRVRVLDVVGLGLVCRAG